jgi:hypothetical protein
MFSGDVIVIVLGFALVACALLIPLVPAVLIYLLFPRTETDLGGPFSGLTLKSKGAFSAYFIVLLASLPLWKGQSDTLKSMMRPTWEVSGQVKVLDERGKEIKYRNTGSQLLHVSLQPDLVYTRGKNFSITVPEMNHKVPSILLNCEKFGDYSIDPDQPQGENVEIDRANHRIIIKSPLVIQKICEGMGCPEKE